MLSKPSIAASKSSEITLLGTEPPPLVLLKKEITSRDKKLSPLSESKKQRINGGMEEPSLSVLSKIRSVNEDKENDSFMQNKKKK